MKGVPVRMTAAKALNMVFSAGKFDRAKVLVEFKEKHHIKDNSKCRSANKPGAHHKINPAGTKIARMAEERVLTIRW